MGKRDKVKAFAVLAAVLGTGAVAMPVCGAADIIGKRVLVEGTLPRAAYGGQAVEAGASALGNTLTLSETAEVLGIAYGGFSLSGSAQQNTLEIAPGSVAAVEVYGGHVSRGTGTAAGNAVRMNGGLVKGDLYGGYTAAGTAQGNQVFLSGSAVVGEEYEEEGNVYGGVSYSGAALDNQVTLEAGSYVYNSVSGGQVNGEESSGAVTGNQVLMTGGTVATDLQGGLSFGSGRVSQNRAVLSGGTVEGGVYGGYAGARRRKTWWSSSKQWPWATVCTGPGSMPGTVGPGTTRCR